MSNAALILVALVAGPLTVLVTTRMSKPKVAADVSKIYNEMSLALVEPQMKRIEVLEAQAEKTAARDMIRDNKIGALERWAHALAAQVIEAGATPVLLSDYTRMTERGDV